MQPINIEVPEGDEIIWAERIYRQSTMSVTKRGPKGPDGKTIKTQVEIPTPVEIITVHRKSGGIDKAMIVPKLRVGASGRNGADNESPN